MLEGVDDAEADEGEHHGDGRHDRHDHPQLGRKCWIQWQYQIVYQGRLLGLHLCILKIVLVGGVDLAGDGGDAGVLPLVRGGAVEKVLHADLLLMMQSAFGGRFKLALK